MRIRSFILSVLLISFITGSAQQNITAKSLRYSKDPGFRNNVGDSSILMIDRSTGKSYRTSLAGGQSSMPAVSNISDLRSLDYYTIPSAEKSVNDKITITLLGHTNPDDGGGGLFYFSDTSTLSDNGGTVLKPTALSGSGRWIRLLNNNEINVQWFGAKADGLITSAATNRAAFNAAKNSIQSINYGAVLRAKGTIYIPRGTYFFDSTLVLDGAIKLKGDEGGSTTIATHLKFSSNAPGILVQSADGVSGNTGGNCEISNIHISAYYMNIYDSTLHGFKIKGLTVLKNCTADNFPGDGFNFDTDALAGGTDQFGNAAFSHIERCRASNNRNGFYTHGGDANVLTFINCDATTNRRWGFWENAFLGNTYIGCHTADNTYQSGNKSQVTHGGKKYICVITNQGVEPGVSANWDYYWIDVGNPYSTYFQSWNADTLWESGGAYNSFPGENSNSSFISCYAEGGQPAQFGYRTVVISGDLAAAIFPPGREMMFQAVGGKYSSVAPLQFARTDKATIVEMGNEGLAISPNEQYTSSLPHYKYINYFDSLTKKYKAYYANLGFPTYSIGTLATNPSEYGVDTMKIGLMEFPRGIYLPRINTTGFRSFQMGTAAPTIGKWAVGDVVLKAISGSNDTTLGWRCVASGYPGTWETMRINTNIFYGGNIFVTPSELSNHYLMSSSSTPSAGQHYLKSMFVSSYGILEASHPFGGNFAVRNVSGQLILQSAAGSSVSLSGGGTQILNAVSTGVAIGTTTPNSSSILDITSTTKGLLLPRMTKAQRDAIVSPAAGLGIYQTDNTPGVRVYNGTNWMRFSETAD